MSNHERSHHGQSGNQPSETGRVQPSNPFRAFRKEDIEQSVTARFEQVASEYSSLLAVKDGHRGFSYQELNVSSNRVAHAILKRGIVPQSSVVVLTEQGFLHIAAILGVLKAGCVFVALDPTNPASRIHQMVMDSGAPLIIADSQSRALSVGLADNHQWGLVTMEEISLSLPGTNPNIPVGPPEPVCMLYTSGSTGAPKGVRATHRGLLRHAMRSANGMHISHCDRLSLLSPAGISAAISVTLVALLNGACVLPFSPQANGLQALAEWLGREAITVYHSVPTLFRHFAQSLAENSDFPSLRLIWLSGEPVLRRDVDLFKSRFAGNVLLRNSLESSEMGAITEYFIHRETPVDGALLPVGYETDGTQVTVVDDEGNELPPHQVGEITVKTPYPSLGYWRRPELTEAVYKPASEGGDKRIYKTGDLGYMLPDRCFVHLGRRDSQVKVRGHRIELAEVEMALMDLPGISEAVVIARTDAMGDTRLIAYVVPEEGEIPSASTLRPLLKQRLPDFMIPARFITLQALPVNPSGKVDRLGLPDPAMAESSGAVAQADVEGEIAIRVAQLWQRMLGLRQVGPHDNFFDLGGDSLLATTMALELEAEFKVRLPLDALFDQPTPAQLAVVLSTGSHANLGACLVPIQPEGSRLPLYCVHGVGGVVAHYRVLAGHLGPDQPVYGLRPRSVTGSFPLSFTVNEMASHYVEDILAFQPDGPYFLCGYSAGGIFAYELARQLRGKGCAVGLLALIDPPKPLPLLGRARLHIDNLAHLALRQKLEYVRERVRRLRMKARRRGLALLSGAHRRGLPVKSGTGTLNEAIGTALRAYRPGRYPGHIVIFVATEEQRLSQYNRNPRRGWRALASDGVEFHFVAGNHGNIIWEPQVIPLARELGECMQMLQEGRET